MKKLISLFLALLIAVMSLSLGAMGVSAAGGQEIYLYKLAGTRTVFWEIVSPRRVYYVILDFDYSGGAGSFRQTYYDIPEGVTYVLVNCNNGDKGLVIVPEYGNFGEGIYTEKDTRKIRWYAVEKGATYSIYLDGSETAHTTTKLADFDVPVGTTEVEVRYTTEGGETGTLGSLKVGKMGTFADDKGTMNEVKISGFKAQSGTSKKIQLSWDAFDGAEKYTIYYKQTSSAKWLKAGTTTKCSATISGLKDGTSYDFKIAATDVETGVLSIKPSTTVKAVEEAEPVKETALPIMLSADYKNGGVALKWSKVTGATEYSVYIAEGNSNTYRKLFVLEDCEAFVENLEAGTYKFRVKAYIDGKWTSLSDCDYIKVTVD